MTIEINSRPLILPLSQNREILPPGGSVISTLGDAIRLAVRDLYVLSRITHRNEAYWQTGRYRIDITSLFTLTRGWHLLSALCIVYTSILACYRTIRNITTMSDGPFFQKAVSKVSITINLFNWLPQTVRLSAYRNIAWKQSLNK